MAEPGSEMQVPPDPGALMAKIKASVEKHPIAPAAEPEAPAEEAAPAEETTETEAPTEETTDEPAAAAADPKKPAAKTEPEKKEPKTARAKQWAELAKKEGGIAKREREVKRAAAEITKERAELQKVQQELARLNDLRNKNPAAFIREMGADPRVLLKTALEAPEETPEQKEIRELKETVARLTQGFDETAKEKREREAREEAQREEHRQIQERNGRFRTIAGVMEKMEGIPGIKSLPKRLQQNIVFEAYDRILNTFNEKGYELPISDVISVLEEELFPEGAQPGSAIASPSARANGAEQPAKPEAKRTPTLRSANATTRAAAGKPASLEDRIRAGAAKLKTVSRA